MRKHNVRALAAALVAALCSTSIMPMNVQAATYDNMAVNLDEYSEAEEIMLTANTLKEIEPSEYYGRNALSQLDDSEKLLKIYDELVECVENQEDYLDVRGYNITINQLSEVVEAYYNDYPQHFWLGSYMYGWDGSTLMAMSVNMTYLFTGDELELAKVQWNNAVNELFDGIDASMSEYEREKLIYDRLAEKIVYSDESQSRYSAYGAIVEGEAVCEGYAKALQYMLYKAGILSFEVFGKSTVTQEEHAWNLVRIDGNYYYTDLTWDDGVSPMNYKYFNISTAKLIEDHAIYSRQFTLPHCRYSIVNGQIVEDEKLPNASDNIVYPEAECDVTFTYDTTNGTAIVTGLKNVTAKSIVIPSKVNKSGIVYEVTGVGKGAFEDCDNIESVVIGNGVTSIEESAFSECNILETVLLPESINYIGKYAFSYCYILESINLPEGLESIEEGTFRGCYYLELNKIPSSVTSIGVDAFCMCGCLNNITIPENVTSIGEDAFYGVNNIVHDGSIEGAPWGARYENAYVDGYVVYNDASKTEILAVSGAIRGEFIIPDSVTSIGVEAFDHCRRLESVVIPDSVTSIGEWAFTWCTNLRKVRLSNNITCINEYTFYMCNSLRDIIIPVSVTEIGKRAFGMCYDLYNLTIPQNEGISIAVNAFEDMWNIIATEDREWVGAPWGAAYFNAYPEGGLLYEDSSKRKLIDVVNSASGNIVIPEGVEIISAAFWALDEVESVVIPRSVTSMNEYIFGSDDEWNLTVYVYEGSYAHEYVLENNIPFQIYTGSTATVTSNGIMMVSKDRNTIVAGHVSEVSEAADRQYRWTAFNKTTQREIVLQDWTDNNEWLNWSPDSFGEYVITGEVRVKDNPASTATASTEAFEFNPHIKGKCQMPYYGEGGGYLIGVESYENPDQSYYYEMLILDCTLLAEGKDAWVYTTGKYKVEEGNAGWCIWQPQYGYYWTLFRVYDANGNMIDQACYGFANVY